MVSSLNLFSCCHFVLSFLKFCSPISYFLMSNQLSKFLGNLEEKKADVKDVKPVAKEAAPTKAKAAVAEPKKAESDDDDDDDSDDEDDSDEAEDGMV